MVKYFTKVKGRPYEFTFSNTLEDVRPVAIVRECARDYWYNHHGCEDSWPLDIGIQDKDGKIHWYEVSLSVEPHFNVSDNSL